ncbi:Cell division cycle protein 123 homolog [Apodemus speciosus]|uniref:Translation initiation factor eIF2 assembly protein n=1 Tax=Apodemus speciosus TaxID=105296 RepID=A0ABQ0EFL8_APOSI
MLVTVSSPRGTRSSEALPSRDDPLQSLSFSSCPGSPSSFHCDSAEIEACHQLSARSRADGSSCVAGTLPSLIFSRVILPLPQNVKDYLLDDGTLVVSGREDPPTCSQSDSGNEEEETQWSDDESTATLTAPEFPEFNTQVQEAINSLGGSVFPKLNWSAPRDAYWIAMNSSLKCKTLSDIFLLFKSSDFITRDFTQPFIHCNDDSPDPCIEYETLVLRKWCELIPGAEFRCFVKENKLIGISQRDYTQYYDHISKQKEEICRCIQDFFKDHLQYKFLDEDFVFDIYRDSRHRGKVWLIDFNPFGEVTDSLLFTWEELTSENNLRGDVSEGDAQGQDSPAFRCTNSEVTVQPSPYLSYGLPKDFLDLSTGEDAHKLIDFLKLQKEINKRTTECCVENQSRGDSCVRGLT